MGKIDLKENAFQTKVCLNKTSKMGEWGHVWGIGQWG